MARRTEASHDCRLHAPRRERGDRGDRGRRNDRRDEPQGDARDESRSEPRDTQRSQRQDFIGAIPTDPAVGPGANANAHSQNPASGDQADQPRQPRERRSRDRYGRERRERSDGGASADQQVGREPNGAETTAFAENSVSNEAPAPQIRGQAAPEFVAVSHEPVSTAVRQPIVQPLVQPTLQPLAPVQSAAAPVSTALPKVASYDLPLQELAQIAQLSGLQWVNSDASKIAEAQSALAAQAKPAHVPRERPPLVTSNEGPLVLVETRRDLREMALPFEKPAA